MKYLLIMLIVNGGGPSVAVAPFKTEAACTIAAKALEAKTERVFGAFYICTPEG
jgi:hypothetical protein